MIAHILSCFDKNGDSVFPSCYTTEELEDIRQEIGTSDFSHLYLNKPVNKEDNPFNETDLVYFDKLKQGETYYTTMCLDLGGSKKEQRQTPTGITIVATDSNKDWYVVFAKKFFVKPLELISLIFELYEVFSPRKIGIEKEKYAIMIKPFLELEEQKRGIKLPMEDLKIKIGERRSKYDRIMSLEPRIGMNKLFVRKIQKDLITQIVQFPKGEVDVLDSLAYHNVIAKAPSRRSRRSFDPRRSPIFYKLGRGKYNQIMHNINNAKETNNKPSKKDREGQLL